jgi:Flp pilus assembly protein TadD
VFCRRRAAAVLLLAILPACRPARPVGAIRLALLPVENLTGDPSLDWVAAAAPQVIAAQLAPAPEVHVFPAGALREAYAARAAQVLHGHLTAAGGGLRLVSVLEDLGRRRTVKTIGAESAGRDGVLGLLGQVARALDPRARPFPTTRLEALRLLAQARDVADFERAAAADPDFGPAYIGWARWLAGRGRQAEAGKVLDAAAARRDRIAPIERAEIAALAATLAGDRESQVRALAELAALTPADVQLPRALGQLEFAAGRLEPAVAWYRRALAAEPESGDLWNMLAYAEAQRGAFDAARKSISEYARLAPEDPNAPDSAGEIDFLAGDFAAAERGFLAASGMNATWRGGGPLLKAAHARAMTGDLAGADGLFLRYVELRKKLKDPLLACRQAQWEFVTGRRRQAMERLESFRAAGGGDPAAYAAAQLAVWKRQTGDRAGARRLALEAAKGSSAPATRRLAAAVLLATEPPAPAAEWTAMKEPALAYALLVEGRFREAAALLRQMIRRTPPAAAGELRILAAWALIESGQPEEARPLARLYPLPEAPGEPAFGSLAMPRVLLVRSRLAPPDEAARLRAVYEKLKGDVADVIGGR